MGRALAIAWDEQPLGREHDAVIAARLGVSAALVQRKRSQRGIAPLRHPRAARAAMARLLWAKRAWWTFAELSTATGFHRAFLGVEAAKLQTEGLIWLAGGGRHSGKPVRVMWNPELSR
jgi:hypothetical protein